MIAMLVSVGVGVKSDVAIKWGTPGGPRINTLKLHIWSTPSWNTFNFERDEKFIFFRSYFENGILELGFSCLDLGLNTPYLPPIYEETSSRASMMHSAVEICECHKLTYLQGVSKKRLFCDSCSTGGSGMIQRVIYQSRTLSNILFLIEHTFLKQHCVTGVFVVAEVASSIGAAAFTSQVSE